MKKVTLVCLSLLVFVLLCGLLIVMRPRPAVRELSEAQLVAMVQSNLVSKIIIDIKSTSSMNNAAAVRGTFDVTDSSGQVVLDQGMPKQLPFRATVHLTPDLEAKLLSARNVTVTTPNPALQKLASFMHRSN